MSSKDNFWLCYVSAYGTLIELGFWYIRILKIFSLIFILKIIRCTVKKRLATFPSPAGMSFTKLSLGGNNLIIPAQREFDR
jgi:hypothetical protein